MQQNLRPTYWQQTPTAYQGGQTALPSSMPQAITPKKPSNIEQEYSPWYRRSYDKVYNEANNLKDKPFYDKYKHSVVSCVGAQDGLYGAAVTSVMGVGKEIQDIYRKIPRQWRGTQDYGGYLSILGDSVNDLIADARGIYTGYTNREANCYDMMKSYYDPKKKL